MTPRATGGRLTLAAGILLMAFAGLVAANASVSALRGDATGADVSFVALVVVVAAVAGRSLHRGAPWAWWISLAMALVGLAFVLPVTWKMLFGLAPAPSGGAAWHAAFFPLATLDLTALVWVLWRGR